MRSRFVVGGDTLSIVIATTNSIRDLYIHTQNSYLGPLDITLFMESPHEYTTHMPGMYGSRYRRRNTPDGHEVARRHLSCLPRRVRSVGSSATVEHKYVQPNECGWGKTMMQKYEHSSEYQPRSVSPYDEPSHRPPVLDDLPRHRRVSMWGVLLACTMAMIGSIAVGVTGAVLLDWMTS